MDLMDRIKNNKLQISQGESFLPPFFLKNKYEIHREVQGYKLKPILLFRIQVWFF